MNKLSVRMKRTGLSILAFPEGTRNCTNQLLLPFKKGPFVVAMEVGVPVLPFVLHGAREVQSRHAYIIHPGTIQVEFLEPIPVEGLSYQRQEPAGPGGTQRHRGRTHEGADREGHRLRIWDLGFGIWETKRYGVSH